jgi:ribosomal protein S12 methylthiotransferase accessory factor YcaO
MTPFFFDISTDTGFPIVWCILYDTGKPTGGVFNGFGCAWSQKKALQRALLEAIQSRSCYIAGSRDDLYRRDFLMMRSYDQESAVARMQQMPAARFLGLADEEPEISAVEMLQWVRDTLTHHGFTDFYVKNAGQPIPGASFSVAKVYAPCLENYRGGGYWQPTKRLAEYNAKYAPGP